MTNLFENHDELEQLSNQNKLGFREKDLLKQIRNHQLFRPLHELEATKNSYNRNDINILENIDTLFLSNYLFDLISDGMIFGDGVERNILIHDARVQIKIMDSSLSSKIASEVVETILDFISNKKNGFKIFNMSYFDPIEKKNSSRKFRLIAFKECDDGKWRYYLTKEGFTVYLSMLEMDSDMEIALNDFRIQKLLERERFSEAVSIAKVNMKRTVEHKQMLQILMRRIQRDVRQIDWKEDVESKLNNSQEHIQERIDEELKMAKIVREQIENGNLSSVNRKQLLILQETVSACQIAHQDLFQQLIPFHEQYLEFHSRTLNVSRSISQPNFEEDLLYEYLSLPIDKLSSVSLKISLSSTLAKQAKIFDPMLLIEYIDKLSIKEKINTEKLAEPEYEEVFKVPSMFSKNLMVEMREYFKELITKKECIDFNALLEIAKNEGKSAKEIAYLSFLLIDQFETANKNQLVLLKKSNTKLNNNTYIQGDNLIMENQNG